MTTPLDYACSFFDVSSNFVCRAQPGEQCNWPDGEGGRFQDAQCHAERLLAAAAMNGGTGEMPDIPGFDKAVAEVQSGRRDSKMDTTKDASIV